jgi:imidazolonepropionase
MNEVLEVEDGAIFFDEKFEWVGTTAQASELLARGELEPDRIIDAKEKTVFPGFVDSHTHLVFAGDRSNEFALRIAGATYQEIASSGGGILTTVNATRKASFDSLYENAYAYAFSAIQHGTIALEIKSGYGLELDTELKMLRVINKLKKNLPIEVVPTFLGAHDFPPEYQNNRDDYVKLICERMIPAIADEGLASYCDCFVDKGYYTIEQARRIFDTAIHYGMKIKMHADELANVGAGKLAGEIGAISADHLLFVSDESLKAMADGGTIATLLPGTSYFIRMPYAPARKIIEKNIPIALASDFNPGSCFTENMQIISSFAVMQLGLSCEEALVASTLNGAAAIELADRIGSIEIGKEASFVVLNCKNYVDMFYHFGINHVESVWSKGEKIV